MQEPPDRKAERRQATFARGEEEDGERDRDDGKEGMCEIAPGGVTRQCQAQHGIDEVGCDCSDQDEAVVDAPPPQADVGNHRRHAQVPQEHYRIWDCCGAMSGSARDAQSIPMFASRSARAFSSRGT